MNTDPRSAKRTVCWAVLPACLAALTLCLPVRGSAQSDPQTGQQQSDPQTNSQNTHRTNQDHTQDQDVEDQVSRDKTKTRKSPLANPLVLPAPGTAVRPGKPLTPPSADFGDYRSRPEDEQKRKAKELPLFGYNFFQPARDIIIARRNALNRRFAGDNAGTQPQNRAAKRTKTGDSASKSDRKSGDDVNTRSSHDQTAQLQNRLRRANGGSDESGDETSDDQSDNAQDPQAQTGTGAARRTRSTGKEADDGDVTPRGTQRSNGEDDTVVRPRTTTPTDKLNADNSDADKTDADKADTGKLDAGKMAATRQDAATQQETEPVNAFADVADPLTQLFHNVSASVPANYQLSGGDRITVRYWSSRQEARTITQTLDAQGALTIEDFGSVVLRGQTADQAEKTLRTHLRRYLRAAEVSVTLGKLRTMPILVSGEAFQPGTYTVPAIATAYNVLYAAGGPTREGSLRNIEIRRAGRLVGTLDIYKLLLVGTQAGDIALQPGDLIYIPRRQSRVIVRGEVLNPAVFELDPHETLHDALGYAGGVKPSAVDQRIQINTLVPGSARILHDVDLKSGDAAQKLALYDGDEVEVFSVRPLVVNRVTVEGAVDQPSDYALEPGMRVSDLLKRARGPVSEAYLTRADLFRWNPDNTTTLIPVNLEKALAHDPDADITLARWDRLKLYTREEVAWTGQRTVTVRGAVQRAGTYNHSANMRVSDLLLQAGGPTPDAFLDRAMLLHQNGDGSYALEYVKLADVLGGNATHDPQLRDNDVLAVYRVGEAQFEPEHVVTIRGAVVAPGPYPRTEKMHLTDLMQMAGGFLPNARPKVTVTHARRIVDGPDGATLSVAVAFDEHQRCAAKDDVALEDGDVVTIQGFGGYQDHVHTITILGAVNNPGPIPITAKNMRLSDAIRAAGGLRPEAFPQGAEFNRDPKELATTEQQTLAQTIERLNTLLNQNTYNRERGKSQIERLKAAKDANSGGGLLGGATGASSAPNPTADALATQIAQQELVSPPRKLTLDELSPNGNIAINLPEALRRPNGNDDLLLVDGDRITIPEKPTTVQVVGAVLHGRGVLYKPGASLDYYVSEAGGFAPDAAKDRITVIHAGGGLKPANQVRNLQAGDVLLVPTRVLAEKISENSNSFNNIFSSLTNSALLFKVVGSVFGL
jgi:protein involved in polysaccharide export with SLBB domain